MALVNLLIPPACLACNQRLRSNQKHLCSECSAKVKSALPGDCPRCGSPRQDGICSHCRDLGFTFEFARSALQYKGPLPDLVHAMKYHGMRSVGGLLADKMAEAAKDYPPFAEYTDLVAIPLHPVRKRERGYNQSEVIARRLAKHLDKNYLDCVSRKRYTNSQTKLEREARLSNLSGAFVVRKPARVKGKNLILVDDVFTTGSTLNEVSRALYAAGANKVAGYTATRA